MGTQRYALMCSLVYTMSVSTAAAPLCLNLTAVVEVVVVVVVRICLGLRDMFTLAVKRQSPGMMAGVVVVASGLGSCSALL